jgi:gamma-glutamyl hercynylcysteine S-oxide synthase
MDNKNYKTKIPNQLKKSEIYTRLTKLDFNIESKKLFELLEDNQSKIIYFYDLLENNKEYCTKYNILYNNNVNPILWQLGHINIFYINNCIDLLENNNYYKENIKGIKTELENSINKKIINYDDYYDSFITPLITRYKYLNNIDITKIKKCYKNIICYLKKYILNHSKNFKLKLNPIDNYVIFLSILHNDMHYEALLFSSKYLGFNKPKNITFNDEYYYSDIYDFNLIINKKFKNQWIDIKGGTFYQGIDNTKKEFHFDNEQPQHKKEISDFTVSKYPITEGDYLLFIESNGYSTKKYWCINGWEFIKNNNIEAPLYWYKCNEKWYVKDWDIKRYINKLTKKPVRNISWYEAKAYCKWIGVRMIKEEEWEYLSTNKGTTLYPWGNDKPNYLRCNIDYKNSNIIDVDYFETINVFTNKTNDRYDSLNFNYVSQLIGNIWEWCDESIYPYDNFKIDPVYREMSYPFFGTKKICRGGCWATSSYLINSKYRNAQNPECRIQWIGFRVCKL